ncbi:MAG: hypothetical protein VB027_10040 [Gordonibacter sp.]|nr:hypothetical protein [Gordonibacter sp.]
MQNIENEAFIFRAGVAATVISEKEGKSLGIYLAEPGFVSNIMRISGTTNRHKADFNAGHYGYAFTDLRGCAVPLEVMRTLFRRDQQFAELMFAHLADHYKDALTSMTLLSEASGEERIAWLLDEFDRVGVDAVGVTHETIARLLGMNRVSVTRLMKSVLSSRYVRD